MINALLKLLVRKRLGFSFLVVMALNHLCSLRGHQDKSKTVLLPAACSAFNYLYSDEITLLTADMGRIPSLLLPLHATISTYNVVNVQWVEKVFDFLHFCHQLKKVLGYSCIFVDIKFIWGLPITEFYSNKNKGSV